MMEGVKMTETLEPGSSKSLPKTQKYCIVIPLPRQILTYGDMHKQISSNIPKLRSNDQLRTINE